METVQVEVWVLVDENGNYAVHHDPDGMNDRYEEEVGEDLAQTATRLVKVTLSVPKPAPVVVSVEVPAERSDVAVKVA